MSKLSHDQFMRLYIRDQGRVYRYVLTLIGNPTDAEELFQATSLTLWERRDQFDPGAGEFAGWAYGIALNHVRNHLRKQTRRGERGYLNDAALAQIAAVHAAHDEDLAARSAALTDCLSKLPAGQRRLVEEYYDADRTVPELAERMGQTAEAIYKTLQRVRKALFECVNKAMGTEGTP
ncbi:MAG: sigma-70 family RNA polymerase sigma factor [Planctomycetes bacterium]|nr:sigma-70 family RNA polymerase sigma factor [Planctomycetota bacterium]